jgi:hypothetical protein
MIQFTILANEYLSRNTNAFYHIPYTGMGNQGNPNYLNDLKNTFNSFSQQTLLFAIQELRNVLDEDLPQIFQSLGFNSITVCVVPRAKAEDAYHANQQLFRATVQSVIEQIGGFVDGTSFIRRHTDTRTTHLRNHVRNYENKGSLPYSGITEQTCDISPNVRGNNILLIDDIYTPNVNIDEDAINAIIKMGARTVTFYAVGKVPAR